MLSSKWDEITREDIIKSIERYDENPKEYAKYKSKSTFLIYNNKEYPAKAIRREAYKVHFNENPNEDTFSGGRPTKNFFEKLNFEIKYIPNSSEKTKYPPEVDVYAKNLIYFGAPGTGKSYKLNEDKKKLQCDYERVTFHHDYSYANFVGTYKPVMKKDENGNKTKEITYDFVPGPFIRTLVKAFKYPNKNHLLIIEEINRANVAAVFGDIFQLLDREKKRRK